MLSVRKLMLIERKKNSPSMKSIEVIENSEATVMPRFLENIWAKACLKEYTISLIIVSVFSFLRVSYNTSVVYGNYTLFHFVYNILCMGNYNHGSTALVDLV